MKNSEYSTILGNENLNGITYQYENIILKIIVYYAVLNLKIDKGGKYLSKYLKKKIEVLKDLGIKISNEDLDVLRGLKSEIAIDNYARKLIMEKEYRI